MNNQLPMYFVECKPGLPKVCTHYEIKSPVHHLPVLKFIIKYYVVSLI